MGGSGELMLGVLMTDSQKLKNNFEHLRECLILVRRDYNTYNALYCDANKELMTATAPTFFTDIGEILQRDWMLQVVKLMDPAVTEVRGEQRENLTIRLVVKQLETEGLLTDEIRNKSKAILHYGKLIKPARNRTLAHRDRQCYFKAYFEGIAMGATTDEQLYEFIENIQSFADLVGSQIGVDPLDFSSSGCKGDAYDLLRCLRESQCAQQGVQPDA